MLMQKNIFSGIQMMMIIWISILNITNKKHLATKYLKKDINPLKGRGYGL